MKPFLYGLVPIVTAHHAFGERRCLSDEFTLSSIDNQVCYTKPGYGNFAYAKSICNSYNGHLVTMKTAEKMEEIRLHAEKTATDIAISSEQFREGYISIWIGLNRDMSGGFEWIDGDALETSFWSANEPNDFSEKCVEAIGHKWNDYNCEGNRRFICEVSSIPVVKRECAPGAMLSTTEHHLCFKKTPPAVSWDNAEKYCLDNHGTLVIIESEAKLAEIKNFAKELLPIWIGNDNCEEIIESTKFTDVLKNEKDCKPNRSSVCQFDSIPGGQLNDCWMQCGQRSGPCPSYCGKDGNCCSGKKEDGCTQQMRDDITDKKRYYPLFTYPGDHVCVEGKEISECPVSHPNAYGSGSYCSSESHVDFHQDKCARCPDGFHHSTSDCNICLLTVVEKKSWSSAQDECKSKNANLVTIDSSAKESEINSLIGELIWIGLRLVDKEFQWVSGAQKKHLNWQTGEPNNDYKNEKCVELHKSVGWNDKNCDEKRSFVCETGTPLNGIICDAGAYNCRDNKQTQRCNKFYPFAYSGGGYCCQHDITENGESISINKKNCHMNHYIQCPEGRKCRDYLDIEKIPIVHQWNKQLSCDGTYSAALCTVQMAVGMTYTKENTHETELQKRRSFSLEVAMGMKVTFEENEIFVDEKEELSLEMKMKLEEGTLTNSSWSTSNSAAFSEEHLQSITVDIEMSSIKTICQYQVAVGHLMIKTEIYKVFSGNECEER